MTAAGAHGRTHVAAGLWWAGALVALLVLLARLNKTEVEQPLQSPSPWFQAPPAPYPELDLDVRSADLQACGQDAHWQEHGTGKVKYPGEGQGGADAHPHPKFSVYIWEPNDHLHQIPRLAAPNFRCDLTNPKVWPHSQPGRGMDGSNSTEPWAYQHAVQHWITQALDNSSLVRLTDDIDEADLVYVNMYCFSMWAYSFSHPFGDHDQWTPEDYIHLILEHIEKSERFQRKMGADYVVVESHPAKLRWTTSYSEERMCGTLRNAYWMVPERTSLCPSDQDGVPQNRAVLLPYNAVNDLGLRPITTADRPTFLFYRGACAPYSPKLMPDFSSGKLLRTAVVEGIKALPRALTGLGKRTKVACTCDICGERQPHNASMERLAGSVFCPVIPGDTQSSRRVSEVILNGCIPVFFGPPFHTLPLADVVDYQSFSVFMFLNDTSQWIYSKRRNAHVMNGKEVLELWKPDAEISTYVTVSNMEEAYRYLLSLREKEVKRLQKNLAKERWKLLYTPPPDRNSSVLGEEVVRKMCHRAMAVRRLASVHGPRLPRAVPHARGYQQ